MELWSSLFFRSAAGEKCLQEHWIPNECSWPAQKKPRGFSKGLTKKPWQKRLTIVSSNLQSISKEVHCWAMTSARLQVGLFIWRPASNLDGAYLRRTYHPSMMYPSGGCSPLGTNISGTKQASSWSNIHSLALSGMNSSYFSLMHSPFRFWGHFPSVLFPEVCRCPRSRVPGSQSV